MLLSAVLAIVVFVDVALDGNARTTTIFTWIASGSMELSWALRVDTLSAVMLVVVTLVSSVVHVYSVGYMSDDKSKPRFMAYLSLFTFFMLMLVTSDNLVQMFFGWEGVGLASYLLIGFWYEKPSACAAAIKAFLVNRVGDVGFALGIAGIFLLFGAVDFDQIFPAAGGMADTTITVFGIEGNALTILCILLFIGAMGKSAQLGLHTWLPDAMEGPTPVSALIHAATMVTAGVFMVCRLSPMFEYAPTALEVVTIVGAIDLLLRRDDRAGAERHQAGDRLFDLLAARLHVLRRRRLGLFGGDVPPDDPRLLQGAAVPRRRRGDPRHAPRAGHAQDGRPAGQDQDDLSRFMWVGSLALAGIGIPGVFGFAGFYSKDMVLEAAYGAHSTQGMVAYWLGIGAAVMTAFYSWRLLFITFHGKAKMPAVAAHAHEAPRTMLWPLWILVAGAVFAGLLGYPYFVGEEREAFWGESLFTLRDPIEAAHHVPGWVAWLPLVSGLVGIAVACAFYLGRRRLPAMLAAGARPLYLFLLNKWYFDELYDRIFVRPALYLGRGLWKAGDGALIDGVGPDGLAAATQSIARRVGRLQSGYLYHYAFAMLIGVVVLVSWYLFAELG